MSLILEGSPGVFLALTVVLGGGAAYLAGRSLAKDWRPLSALVLFMIPLGAGVRFLHFALFQHQLLSLGLYLSHTAILLAFALLGYRIKRVSQMTTQYPWLYERSGALSWRQKP